MLNFDPFNCTRFPCVDPLRTIQANNLRRIYNFNEGDFARFADLAGHLTSVQRPWNVRGPNLLVIFDERICLESPT